MPIAELMGKEFKDTEWIVERLLPAESVVAISGQPASYKTWFILNLAITVAKGDILFDKFVTNQTSVLIIDEENGERLLQKRLIKLRPSPELPMYFLSLSGYKLTKDSVKNLILFCKEKSIKLIIFDSLVRIHTGDENDAMKMAGVFSLLKEFPKNNISVIFTHHNRKQGIFRANPSQDMRGSSDILASVDGHLAIERKDEFLTVNQTKLRQSEEIKPFRLNIINDEEGFSFEFAGELDEVLSKKTDFQKAIISLLEQEGEPMYKKEIFNKLKASGMEGGYSTFKDAIQELVDKTMVFEQRGERNKVFCSLKPFDGKHALLDLALDEFGRE